VKPLQVALLAWYRRHKRAMPWRETRDPYRVWVSEIMLQQTQVATATPYYVRFMERFPTVGSLARASQQEVLAAWSGLGYYRRARMLHEAAGVVVREHAGQVPSDPTAFAALPGVSIGFGLTLPVLDGNVARVLSRLTGRPLAVKRPADAKVLWDMAEQLIPRGRSRPARTQAGAPDPVPGDWNQALMELGATVCTPRSPRCSACPVRAQCVAFATGQQESLPPAAERRRVVRVRRAIAVVWQRGKLLVARRTGAHLDGLWEPPGVELARGDDAHARLQETLRGLGVRATLRATRQKLQHTITHHAITVQVWRGTLTGAAPRTGSTLRWVAADDRRLALSALARRVAEAGERTSRARRAR
jgi:A/G-specific adenine glycosylase